MKLKSLIITLSLFNFLSMYSITTPYPVGNWQDRPVASVIIERQRLRAQQEAARQAKEQKKQEQEEEKRRAQELARQNERQEEREIEEEQGSSILEATLEVPEKKQTGPSRWRKLLRRLVRSTRVEDSNGNT